MTALTLQTGRPSLALAPRVMLAVVLGLIFSRLGFAAEPAEAPRLEDVIDMMRRRQDLVESIKVSYRSRQTVFRELKGQTENIARDEIWRRYVMRGAERWSEGSNYVKSDEIRTVVEITDGEMMMSAHTVMDGNGSNRRVNALFLDDIAGIGEARVDRINENDYVFAVFSKPMSSRQRADAPRHKMFLPDRFTIPDSYRASTVELDGMECILVESPGYDKVWVDPALGGAVRRREEMDRESAAPALRYMQEFSDFVRFEPGVWAPKKIKTTHFCSPLFGAELANVPYLEVVIQVEQIGINNVVDEDFQLPVRTGVDVHDFRTKESFAYGEEKEIGLEELAAAAGKVSPGRAPGKDVNIRGRIIGGAVMAAIVAIAMTIMVRRRRRSIEKKIGGMAA